MTRSKDFFCYFSFFFFFLFLGFFEVMFVGFCCVFIGGGVYSMKEGNGDECRKFCLWFGRRRKREGEEMIVNKRK